MKRYKNKKMIRMFKTLAYSVYAAAIRIRHYGTIMEFKKEAGKLSSKNKCVISVISHNYNARYINKKNNN